MSIALEAMKLIIRDKFERDWNGRDEPYQDEPDAELVALVKQVDGALRQELVEAAEEAMEAYDWDTCQLPAPRDPYEIETDPDLDLSDQRSKYWIPRIPDTEVEEFIEYTIEYFTKTTQACIDDFEMIAEHIPALRPRIAEEIKKIGDIINTMFANLLAESETFIPEAYEAGRRAGEKAIIIPKDDHYQGGV